MLLPIAIPTLRSIRLRIAAMTAGLCSAALPIKATMITPTKTFNIPMSSRLFDRANQYLFSHGMNTVDIASVASAFRSDQGNLRWLNAE